MTHKHYQDDLQNWDDVLEDAEIFEDDLPDSIYSRPDFVFPIDELQPRIDNIRLRMAELELDALLITTPENIFYLSGYQTLGYWYFQCLVVPADQEPFMVLRELEIANVTGRTYINHSFTYKDNELPMQALNRGLKEFNLLDKKIGIELHSYFLRNTEFSEMKRHFKDVSFSDVSGIVEYFRMVKSGLEIDNLQKAGRFTKNGIQAGLKTAQVGKTENHIAAAFYQAALEAGSHYMAVPPFVASGPRSYMAHATFNNRTLEPYEFILLEGAAAYDRYHTPCMRTIYTGRPEPWFKDVEALLQEAITTTIAAMKPGRTAHDIDMVNQSVISKNKFGGVQNSRSGYSIGIAFAPDWGEGHIISLIRDNELELRENMTFHVLSYIEVPSSDNSTESRFGLTDSVYVTPAGGKSLVNLPYSIQFTES